MQSMQDRFIIVNGNKVYVSRDVWQYHVSNVNHVHKQARRRGECRADGRKVAACSSDCYTCRYWMPKGISADERLEHNDGICGNTDAQMVMRCREIIADMARVDPDGEVIGSMLMNKCDIKDIAERLGIPLSTCYQRIRRIGKRLEED